jgi:hypothetical protein
MLNKIQNPFHRSRAASDDRLSENRRVASHPKGGRAKTSEPKQDCIDALLREEVRRIAKLSFNTFCKNARRGRTEGISKSGATAADAR